MEELQVKLELSLRRITMITVAEIIWKSPDITKKITNSIQKGELVHRLISPSGQFRDRSKEKTWQELTDSVLEKAASLVLPKEIEKDLQNLIVSIGEQIFCFYEEKHFDCKWCKFSTGTIHNFSFTCLGTMKDPCLLLHWKYIPQSHEVRRFLASACRRCDEKIVDEYRDEIIAWLEAVQPGLDFNSKSDVVFDILCAWNFMFFHQLNEIRFLPQMYLKNTDCVIPLEDVLKLFVEKQLPHTLGNILAKKLLDSPLTSDISLIPQHFVNDRKEELIADRRYYRFQKPNWLLFGLQLLPPDQMLGFARKNANKIILVFLDLWPYVELVPQILDYCIEKKIDLKCGFLLSVIARGVGRQNKYKAKKILYLKLFRSLWCVTPESEKTVFLAEKIGEVVLRGLTAPIVEFMLTDEDLKKKKTDLDRLITDKCQEFLKNEKIEIVMDLVSDYSRDEM